MLDQFRWPLPETTDHGRYCVRRGPQTAIIIVCVALCACGTSSVRADYMFVQAHRGYSSHFPELTLLAFEQAILAGADRLEMDLAMTADGHVVILHDTSVDRTTDGHGRVDSFTLEELKELDAGLWKGNEFAGQRIPTLREVIDLVAGRAELNLEIKTGSRTTALVRRTVTEAVRIVETLGVTQQVLFSSFDLQALLMVREENPDLRLLLIDWSPPSRYDGLDMAIDNNLYAWSPSAEYATEERIRRAADAGLSIHVGASPGRQINRYHEWGVDGVSSNNPRALVLYLESLGLRATE